MTFNIHVGLLFFHTYHIDACLQFPVGPPPVFPGQTADICCSQFQNFGLPEGLYILGDVFIAKYPSIFDTTPSNVIVPQTLPSGPRVCFGGSVPVTPFSLELTARLHV